MDAHDAHDAHDDDLTFGAFVVAFTRVWLPLLIAAVGVALIALGGGVLHGNLSHLLSTSADEGSAESATGVALIIVALIVWMINWMYRLGVSSNAERDDEERAREYFDRTGRWPEDDARSR